MFPSREVYGFDKVIIQSYNWSIAIVMHKHGDTKSPGP
jgi:hypothetical protein